MFYKYILHFEYGKEKKVNLMTSLIISEFKQMMLYV